MTILLDVNVLVALAWPNHIHHERALAWFNGGRSNSQTWATSSLTESGFVRVSSNARIVPEAKAPTEAVSLLRRITALQGHEFWNDDVSFARSPLIDPERLVGYRQVTDAHLVALALRHQGRLATFDRNIVEVVPRVARAADVLVLVS